MPWAAGNTRYKCPYKSAPTRTFLDEDQTGFFIIAFSLGLSACSAGPISRADAPGFSQEGEATFYADKFQGRLTASGERFNQRALTAAHSVIPPKSSSAQK